MKLNWKKLKPDILIPVVCVILTLFVSLNRIPFFDEAHGFMISQLKLSEIFFMTRIEGHPFLWYLLSKLFTIKQSFYPYPMLFLAWITGVFVVFVFWLKSPFNILQKTLVIFSYPFFSYFLVVSRPYGLTILFMFLTLYFLNKNRPILLSFLLFVLMNTTVIGMISAFCFFIVFIYKTIKEKNIKRSDFCWVFGILTLSIVVFILQFWFVKKTELMDNNLLVGDFLREFCSYVINPFLKFNSDIFSKLLFKVVVFILVFSSLILFFKKSKESFIYFVLSNLGLTFLFIKIYVGAPWHYYFYFVNFLVSLWLCYDKIKEYKIYRFFVVCFLVLLLNPYSMLINGKIYVLDTSKYKNITKDIVDFSKNNGGKYFCFDIYGPVVGVFPYLKKDGFEIYNLKNQERGSFDALKSTFELKKTYFSADELAQYLDKKRKNYLLASMFALDKNTPYPKNKYFKGEQYTLNLYLVFEDKKNGFAIYEIGAH